MSAPAIDDRSTTDRPRTSLIYPQKVTLYQVDDQIYSPEEVATTNLFNTFLDALDGSYCNYTAYGETGDDPSIDAIYPDPAAGGYKGESADNR